MGMNIKVTISADDEKVATAVCYLVRLALEEAQIPVKYDGDAIVPGAITDLVRLGKSLCNNNDAVAVVCKWDKYSHLTGDQRDVIRDAAIALMHEGDELLDVCVAEYIGGLPVYAQLEAFNNRDQEVLKVYLSFDPETGRPWLDEEDR